MLLLKKKSSKREKRPGAWPYLKTVKDHDDAVASNTECVVLVWAQIKFVSPLWQKLKLESTPLERLDSFGSNFPLHPGTFQILHSRSAFCVKFPTPWVRTTVKYPKVAGDGRGDVTASSWTAHFTNAEHSQGFVQLSQVLPTPLWTRPIIQRNVFPDGHLNLPIRQLEREKDLNYFM